MSDRHPVRLADLLAPLSLATDLAMGQPAEDAMRACLLGTGLARRMGLPEADVASVFTPPCCGMPAVPPAPTRKPRMWGATNSPSGPWRSAPISTRRPTPNGLSEREVEVLRLVAEALSNRDIAGRLFISPRTAESHVQHSYAKIGMSTRAGAAMFAMRHDLVR